MLNKSTYPVIFLISLFFTARGQELLTKATLIDDTGIVLDSNFQIPSKPLPFDKHFGLKFSLPGKVEVLGFLLIPINRNNQKSVTRRDWRIYTRSRSRSKIEKRSMRKHESFNYFKDPDVEYPFFERNVKVNYNAGKSDVILLIPPLEPRQDYMLRIYTNDNKMLNIYLGMTGALAELTNSKSEVDTIAFNALRRKYEEIQPKFFRKDDFFQFLSNISCINDILLEVNIKDLKLGKLEGYRQEIELRFVFSKTRKSYEELSKTVLDSNKYLSEKTDGIPERISLAYLIAMAATQKILDADGGQINYRQDKNSIPYRLYLYVIGSKKPLGKGLQRTESKRPPLESGIVNTASTKVELIPLQQESAVYNAPVAIELTSDLLFLSGKPNVITWKPLPTLADCNNNNNSGLAQNVLEAADYKPSVLIDSPSLGMSLGTYEILVKSLTYFQYSDQKNMSNEKQQELLKVLGLIYNMPPNYINNSLTGRTTLVSPYVSFAKHTTDALSNLNTSLKTLNMLEDLVRLAPVSSNDPSTLRNLDTFLPVMGMWRKVIQQNIELLGKKIEANKQVTEYFTSKIFMPSPLNIGNASTEVINFMTASKFKIVPDFGFVIISNFPNKGLVNDLVPYLGFNINFRSINKDVPMNKLENKHWSYYFSFIMGITLTSIEIPNKREDLFGSKSLMAGFGFRLNNYLKIIGGGVFFKTFNTNPLITRKSVGTSPFAGLSIDYELTDLFGGIKSIFK